METTLRPIDSCPDETLLNIFNYLTPREWGVLSQVSMRIKKIVEDETLWRAFAIEKFPDSSPYYQSEQLNKKKGEPLLKRCRVVVPNSWKEFCHQTALFYRLRNPGSTTNAVLTSAAFHCIEIFKEKIYGFTQKGQILKGNLKGVVKKYPCPLRMQILSMKVGSGADGEPLIYLGYGDGTILILNRKAQYVNQLLGHGDKIVGLELSDHHLISASSDTTIRIWNKSNNHSCERTLDTLKQMWSFLTLGQGKIFASCFALIGIWNSETFELIAQITPNELIYCMRTWNNTLFCSTIAGTLSMWNLETYEHIFGNHP